MISGSCTCCGRGRGGWTVARSTAPIGPLELQIAGMSQDADEDIVVRRKNGDVQSVWRLSGGRLVAAVTINSASEHIRARRLISQELTPERKVMGSGDIAALKAACATTLSAVSGLGPRRPLRPIARFRPARVPGNKGSSAGSIQALALSRVAVILPRPLSVESCILDAVAVSRHLEISRRMARGRGGLLGSVREPGLRRGRGLGSAWA